MKGKENQSKPKVKRTEARKEKEKRTRQKEEEEKKKCRNELRSIKGYHILTGFLWFRIQHMRSYIIEYGGRGMNLCQFSFSFYSFCLVTVRYKSLNCRNKLTLLFIMFPNSEEIIKVYKRRRRKTG